MRLKLDENLPIEGVEPFLEAGHDASSVVEQRLAGADDPTIDEVCKQERRVLVTLDIGFGDIRVYPPAESPGRILLRPRSQEKPHLLSLLTRVCELLRERSPTSTLWVVDEEKVRIRE